MTPRLRTMIAGALVLSLLGGAWFGVVVPKRKDAASLAAQIAEAEQRRDAATTQATIADAARASYRRNQATYVRLGRAVPATANVASLVLQLESAAKTARVDFRSVRVEQLPAAAPAPPAAEDAGAAKDAGDTKAGEAGAAPATDPNGLPTAIAAGVTPVPFTFTFAGDYFDLRRLLKAVHDFTRVRGTKVSTRGRLLTVDDVTMHAGSKGLPHVNAEITARAYVAPMPGALPATGPTP